MPLHLDFGLFDALADLDFLFAGEQRHFAHLVHVHPHRVVQNFQPGIFFLFRFGGFGALDLGLVHDFDVQSCAAWCKARPDLPATGRPAEHR